MQKHTIILAHGILGVGEYFPKDCAVNYFFGIAKHFRRQGHEVFAPQVNPIGGVVERGKKLASVILAIPPSDQPIHIIAHSMGGLDARYALSFVEGVAPRVKTLVTIGTPHRGSPVADAIVDPVDRVAIPQWLRRLFSPTTQGLLDLTTTAAIARDESTPDVTGVKYIEVAGDASRCRHELLLFRVAALIGKLKGHINDGVVTKESALRPGTTHLDDWPVDHAGQIGWNLETRTPDDSRTHLQRYDAILEML